MRYWSWLFAAREARAPLLGIYALLAEWRALLDPGTETGIARVKLLWWREEMERLVAGSPVHPISRYLSQLPGAASTDLTPLRAAVEAAAVHVSGVPLECGLELQSHAGALYGAPLMVAALLGAAKGTCCPLRARDSVRDCMAALAAAEYLSRALGDYRREARVGRISFAIDELLAAGIDNEDLAAATPPPRLQAYLNQVRQRAAGHYSRAAQALGPAERPPLRHLLVLATLGARHLTAGTRRAGADFRLADLYNAWSTARRAAAAR